MGYLIKKYSTIFRGPFMMYWKVRNLTGAITKHMGHIYDEVYKKIPEDEQNNEVSNALDEIKKLIKEMEKTGEREFKFLFDLGFQQEDLLNPLVKLEKSLKRLKNIIPDEKEVKNIMEEIGQVIKERMVKTLRELEKYDKLEYKEVMNVINAAEPTDKMTFMNKMKTIFKDIDVSQFRNLPIRKNVRAFKRDLQHIGRDIKIVEKDIKEFEKDLKDPKKVASLTRVKVKIEAHAKKLADAYVKGYYDAYKAMKRVFQLAYLLEQHEDLINIEMEEWVADKKLPTSPVKKDIQEIKKIRTEFSGDMHDIAQALRRIYQKEKKIERGLLGMAA